MLRGLQDNEDMVDSDTGLQLISFLLCFFLSHHTCNIMDNLLLGQFWGETE